MKRINIFGSSERIAELGAEKITRLLSSKIPSIGLNHFPNHYPNVNYWLFVDDLMVQKMDYKGQKIITCEHIYKSVLRHKPKYVVADRFEPNDIEGSFGNCGFYAIWWAIEQGYTHINLYGILDGEYPQQDEAGKVPYTDIFAGEQFFNNNKFQKLKEIVETGFYGKATIKRPLLKEIEEEA